MKRWEDSLRHKVFKMMFSTCQSILHLSSLWDSEGLCSASSISPPLNKAPCLMKRAAWETLWKENYYLEAVPGKRDCCTSNGSETHNVQSWDHSENWTHLSEEHLKINSWEYIGTDKRPLFGKRQWESRELATMHTGTVETILVSHWEYVSAYYLLLFQICTVVGFIVRGKCSRGRVGYINRRLLYPEATMNSWR